MNGGMTVYGSRTVGGVESHEVDRLRERIGALERERDEWRAEAQKGAMAVRAVEVLRKQLNPLWGALRAIYGEIEAGIGIDIEVETSRKYGELDPRKAAIWEDWKRKLPGRPAEVIEALMIHGAMNTQQLAIACKCRAQRITEVIVRLNKAGLINKNGRVFSLKEI